MWESSATSSRTARSWTCWKRTPINGWSAAAAEPVAAQLLKGAGCQGCPDVLEQARHEPEVVDARQLLAELFSRGEQVPQVTAGMVRARPAVTVFVDGTVVTGERGVAEVDAEVPQAAAVIREPLQGPTVPGVAGRTDAVERIAAAGDAFDYAGDVSDAEQVSGLPFRQFRHCPVDHVEHVLVRPAEVSTDCQTPEIQTGDEGSAFFAQFAERSALNDAIQQLGVAVQRAGSVERFEAADCPAVRAFHAGTRVFLVVQRTRTFIKGEDHVCAELALH